MAIQGSYRINFTDPKKGSFVIEPYTVDGNVTPTSDVLNSKAVKATTSLQLPGQYTPNYGEMVHENILHVLENFAGDTEPSVPTEGQLWYDTGSSYAIVSLVANGVIVSGNASAIFGQYIANATQLIAWYGPVSTTDNSYNSVTFLITSCYVNSDNNTVATITAVDGTALSLPDASVGGFVTVSQSSRIGRMKVAVTVNGSLEWGDVVNVVSSAIAPAFDYQQDGDLWYDTTTKTLKVSLNGVWTAVTAGFLPLAGGTMTGPIVMNANPITFNGTVSTASTLTNKSYVDQAIATAIEPLESSTGADLTALTARVATIETTVPTKVSKTGDNFTGALIFGPAGSTSTLSIGIDMKNIPIVNPSITWSSTDYLTALGETHNVTDKQYVANALKQHLIDAVHGGKSFIVEQTDGTGQITDSLYFADTADTLTWKLLSGNTYGMGLNGSALALYTADTIGSAFEFRQSGTTTTDPLFKISDSAARSWNSLYIHDGQPQPVSNGAVTDQNDDTKAATKGYVTSAINDLAAGQAPITSATFSYATADITYPLTLVRSGADNIVVDINHKHAASRLDYTYTSLGDWAGGYTDLVSQAVGGLAVVSVSTMLDALNSTKAPISGAKFGDFPQVGGDAQILDINNTNNSFTLFDTDITFPDDYAVVFIAPDETQTSYTILSSVEATDPYGSTATYYLVDGTLPTIEDVTKDIPYIRYGAYGSGDARELVNAATVKHNMSAYVKSKLAAVKSNIMIKVADETTALTTGTKKYTFRMPQGMTLTAVRASLGTAQVSGSVLTVDVNQNGTSILSTKLTFDNTEKTTVTAAVPAVISTASLIDDAEITIDIDQVGSGEAAGLKLVFIGTYV